MYLQSQRASVDGDQTFLISGNGRGAGDRQTNSHVSTMEVNVEPFIFLDGLKLIVNTPSPLYLTTH